jgi:outer membrane biosynthesis protein TonB
MSSEVAHNQRFIQVPSTALVISIALHLSIPLFVFILKGFDAWNFNRKDTKAHAESFIQVDVVALPDVMLNDKTVVDTSQPIVAHPKSLLEEAKAKDDLMVLTNEKDRIQKQKEKEMADKTKKEKERKSEEEKALKKLTEDAKREQALKALFAKNGKTGRSKMLGNKTSQGTAATGAIGDLKNKWAAQVGQAIKEHFNVFPWQKKKNLVANVHIDVYANGKIRARRITKKSADLTYDSAVLQAVDETQTLPVPEDPSIMSDGITVEMRPED